MLPSRMINVWSSLGGAPVPSMTRTWRSATTTHRDRVPVGDLQFSRDARDRVLGDFDPMPLLGPALGPDPNGGVGVDRLQLIDGTPSPIGAACYEEQRCDARASRHQDFHTFYSGI